MKQAIAYMMIGALAVTCAKLYVASNSELSCKMNKAKQEMKDKVPTMI